MLKSLSKQTPSQTLEIPSQTSMLEPAPPSLITTQTTEIPAWLLALWPLLRLHKMFTSSECTNSKFNQAELKSKSGDFNIEFNAQMNLCRLVDLMQALEVRASVNFKVH